MQATAYRDCSGNKVNISPAIGTEISNGVMNLTIPIDVTGVDYRIVQDYVTKQLSDNGFDKLDYTNVMYVLPVGVRWGRLAATAYLNGRLSVISNEYVSKIYILMHEIGHNFGHHHSSTYGNEYGDNTGMMGHYYLFENDAPRLCFNGAKSWYFGWYSDRHTDVTPTSSSRILNMLSIDDYLNGQATAKDQYTVARIKGGNEVDLFIMYNRAEGINSQVPGHKDHVTLVSQRGESQRSILEAGLSVDESDETLPSRWSKSNWNGSGNTLVIQLCQRVAGEPDYAKVIVYLEGVNDLSCDCELGMYKFEIEVKADAWGDETSWRLRERFGNTIFQDRNLPSNISTKKELCIDNSKCYKFKIKDESRNGLCCEYGDGWYQIKTNGKS